MSSATPAKNSEEVEEATHKIKLSLLKWNKQQLGLCKRGKPGLTNAYPVMIAMKDLKCSTYILNNDLDKMNNQELNFCNNLGY